MFRSLLAAFMILGLGAGVRADDHWPQFRGEKSLGVSDDANLPDEWSATRNVAWRIDIPGRGWSSPIVWGDKIFVTTSISEGKVETAKKGLYFGGERSAVPPDVHRWMVYCIDFGTGRVLWERMAYRGLPDTDNPHHIKNTYASETPVTDGERVYAYFGNLGLFCYDTEGRELWTKKWGSFKVRAGWGTAASPIVYKDRVYVLNDNEERSFLVALDKKTGRQVWRVERDEKSNWSTPFIWENGQRTEIVTLGTGKVRSYGLDGKLLWELKGMSSVTIATPFAKDGLLYISSGFVMQPFRPLYAIRPGAAGDISLKAGEERNKFIAWRQKTGAPYNPTSIIYGNHVYVLKDRGTLSCSDSKSGAEVYTDQRLPVSSSFTSSPWAYDGKIFCLSEDGDTIVIQAGPAFKVLGKNSLNEMCMATPAIARGSLILRTESKLYRIQKDASLVK